MPSFTTPPTWTTGDTVTAAQLQAYLTDNVQYLYDLFNNAWSSYTPAVVQSGSVTCTVNRAKYAQFGKFVTVSVHLSVTGSGTTANKITCTLPVNRAYTTNLMPIGGFTVVDSSTASNFRGHTNGTASAQTVEFFDFSLGGNVGVAGGAGTFALASGDTITFYATYEAA